MELTTALRAFIMALAFSPVLAAPAEATKNCVVNSRDADSWVESGLRRRRTTFSAVNTDPSVYCKYWGSGHYGCQTQTNVQCGWDANYENGTWRVDASFVQGPAGDLAYNHCLDHTRNHWIKDTGCRTGS